MELMLAPESTGYQGGGRNFTSVDTLRDIDNAEKNGFSVVYAEENTILLDLDNQEAINLYEQNLPILRRCLPHLELNGPPDINEWNSKSGNKHKSIYFYSSKVIEPYEKLLLEVILGSDPKRAIFSLARLHEGVHSREASLLFKPNAIKIDNDYKDFVL